MTIYLSGPMTGYKDYNYPKFQKIAKDLRAKGFKVIDPATDVKPVLKGGREITIAEMHEMMNNNSITQDESWGCFLRGDIITIMKDCDAIYLLKGWKNSKGARFERSCSKYMGFTEYREGDLGISYKRNKAKCSV